MADADTVEFYGEQFRMAERVGLMPLMRYAKFAKAGVDAADMEGLVAMHDLLEQCIHPDDWQRFSACADRNRVEGDELMQVVADVLGRLTERPTGRPSDSSDGPKIIEPNSVAGSSDRVMDRLSGRPDLQLMVVQAREARAS